MRLAVASACLTMSIVSQFGSATISSMAYVRIKLDQRADRVPAAAVVGAQEWTLLLPLDAHLGLDLLELHRNRGLHRHDYRKTSEIVTSIKRVL